METIDKELLIKKTEELKIKHEAIKAEMIKNLNAIQILDSQYKELEQQLYKVEDDYINVMKELV
jgi:uncharacterized protein YhaN